MTREEAKEMLPIIQAWADEKTVDWYDPSIGWRASGFQLDFDKNPKYFRIKSEPESKYRPFKSQEECWNEMLKHQPFGYIKRKGNNEITQITGMNTVHYGELHIDLSFNSNSFYTADNLFDVYTFTDGEPFGIKEE